MNEYIDTILDKNNNIVNGHWQTVFSENIHHYMPCICGHKVKRITYIYHRPTKTIGYIGKTCVKKYGIQTKVSNAILLAVIKGHTDELCVKIDDLVRLHILEKYGIFMTKIREYIQADIEIDYYDIVAPFRRLLNDVCDVFKVTLAQVRVGEPRTCEVAVFGDDAEHVGENQVGSDEGTLGDESLAEVRALKHGIIEVTILQVGLVKADLRSLTAAQVAAPHVCLIQIQIHERYRGEFETWHLQRATPSVVHKLQELSIVNFLGSRCPLLVKLVQEVLNVEELDLLVKLIDQLLVVKRDVGISIS